MYFIGGRPEIHIKGVTGVTQVEYQRYPVSPVLALRGLFAPSDGSHQRSPRPNEKQVLKSGSVSYPFDRRAADKRANSRYVFMRGPLLGVEGS